MNPQIPYALLREGFQVLAVSSAPLFAVLLVAGLLVGILQAATQVNDSAASFLPRLFATLIVLWLFGSWMMERLASYFGSALVQMGNR
jgi:flagellar biosynthetic protein FliQ